MEFLVTLIVLAFIMDQIMLDGEGRKAAVKMIQNRNSQPKAIGRGTSLDPHDCEVYDERLVDLKMVKAGLMRPSEVAQCDNNRCPNCK